MFKRDSELVAIIQQICRCGADRKGDFSTIFFRGKGTYDKNISFSGTTALKRRIFLSFFFQFRAKYDREG